MPKLRPFDSDSRKIPVPLGGLITALVALGLGLWSSGAAGSILDSAEVVVLEVEPAEPNQGQSLNAYFSSFRSVGIAGALSDPNDQDIYQFTIGPDWDVQLLFEIQAIDDKAITAVAAGPDSRVYFVSENSVWRIDLSRPAEPAEWVVTSVDLVDALGLEDDTGLEVGPIAANQDPNGLAVLLIGLGPAESPAGGSLVALDRDDELTVVATGDDVTAVTGSAQVEWAALAADETGRFYGADQVSGSVLKIDRQAGAEPAAYLVSLYTDAGDLQDAIERDVMEDVSDGLTIIPETILAETD
ncbi:MAG: hypothetical protein JW810_08775, partial [Sedimentisphaerales bacterium]|nr:hypothetical protein [Sedimentisphaerales bacterium]